jgi:prepilin-type N-terminal cleavage/methylation domain-containing protein
MRTRDDDGFTLPELLVAMALAGVLLTAIAAVTISVSRSVGAVSSSIAATADARLAVESMTRRLRVADSPHRTADKPPPAIAAAGTRGITFYANIARPATSTSPGPTQVEYVVDEATSCLRETLTPAAGAQPPYTYDPTTSTTRCVAHGVIVGPVFSYYATDALDPMEMPDGTLEPSLRGAVTSVVIRLQLLDASSGAGRSAVLQDRVTLANRALNR